METEIEPTGEPDGGAPPADTEPAGDADGGAAGGAPAPDAGGTEGGGEQPARRTSARQARREEWQRNRDQQSMVAELKRHNEELTKRLDQALGRMSDVVERSTPPREDPLLKRRKDLDDRWDKVVARLDKDPSAAQDFRDLQVEYGKLGAAEESAQQRREAPPPPNPVAQSLFVEFPWLHPQTGDAEARAMVNGEAAKLARKEKRDMNNPQVRYHTLRQAAATVARDLDYPVPTTFAPATNGSARDRVSGTGGRSGTAAGGGSDPFVGMEADIEAAATIMYPSLDKPAAVAKWKSTVGKRHILEKK